MIPKIVYYCWFGQEKSVTIQNQIKQWKRCLPTYTFVEINEGNFDYTKYRFTVDAYDAGKFAYVSDVARLIFLKETGGIYLDTDVEVCQPFDSFLGDDVLHVSMEYYGHEITGVNVGTIIAPRNHPLLEQVLKEVLASAYSENRPPVNVYFNRALSNLIYRNKKQEFPEWKTKVYQSDIFCTESKRSVTIHRFENSWGAELTKIQKAKRFIGVGIKKIIGRDRFQKIMKRGKI